MSKVATLPATFSAEDMWNLIYVKEHLDKHPKHKVKVLRSILKGQIIDENGKVVITYFQFKAVLSAANKKIGNKLIKGYAYDLMNGLGDLFVARIERSETTKGFDRGASFKLRKQLKEKGVPLTNDNWKVLRSNEDQFIGTTWHDGNGRLSNINLYSFKTAGGQPGKGFRQLLSQSVKRNPAMKGLYPLLPKNRLNGI